MVDGIDSDAARQRLWGDLALFHSSLDRLLNEFADFSVARAVTQVEELDSIAVRMHKLSGCASMLGATKIQEIAASIWAACSARDIDGAGALTLTLAGEFVRLRQSVARVRAIDAAQLERFLSVLRMESPSALYRFGSLSPMLLMWLGRERFQVVSDLVSTQQYHQAADALENFRMAQ